MEDCIVEIDFSRISRLEIIGETGREYSIYNCELNPQIQDNGRTLKLFVKEYSW